MRICPYSTICAKMPARKDLHTQRITVAELLPCGWSQLQVDSRHGNTDFNSSFEVAPMAKIAVDVVLLPSQEK